MRGVGVGPRECEVVRDTALDRAARDEDVALETALDPAKMKKDATG